MKKIYLFLAMLLGLFCTAAYAQETIYNTEVDETHPLIMLVDQFSSPMEDSSEGNFYSLLGRASDSPTHTGDDFWHSDWQHGSQTPGTHYFQVEMLEGTHTSWSNSSEYISYPSKINVKGYANYDYQYIANSSQELEAGQYHNIAFRFKRRSGVSNNVVNDHTTRWSIYGTNNPDADKDDCELLTEVETPYSSNTEELTSEPFDPKGYRYLRFYSEEQYPNSRGYFHLSRFQLFPVNVTVIAPLEDEGGTPAVNVTIVDGVRQKPTYATTGFTANAQAYLYNVGTRQFFTEGNSYGTQVSLGDTGLLVYFTLDNGAYVLKDKSITRSGWYDTFYASETAMYVDRNGQTNYFFDIEENNDGTFRIAPAAKNPTYGDYAGGGVYLGFEKNSTSTALSPFVDEDEAYVDWALVSVSSYNALESAIELYNKAQELKAAIDKIRAVNGDPGTLEMVYLDENATMAQIEDALTSSAAIYDQAKYAYALSLINNATDKSNVDITVVLNNPDFEESNEKEVNTKGWTTEYTHAPQHDYTNVRTGGTSTNLCYEAYQAETFDVYQEIEGMPVGVYEIEVQGFYRYKYGRDEGWYDYQAQEVEYVKPTGVPVYVYLNNNSTPFANIYSEPVPAGTLYQSSSYGYAYTDPNGQYWYPNEMYNSAIAFQAGMYKRSAYGLIAHAGDAFRIGVKGSTGQDYGSWVIWDNFKLRYRGFKADVVQPILEVAMADCQEYRSMLMGKTEYAALTKAFTDAEAAIAAQDGEAMFNALNDFYDVKESVLASKDLFLAQGVSTDLTNLQEAISNVANEKMSAATRTAATTLEAGIAGNTIYEGSQIEQLKNDVSNAINSLYNSVSLYSQLGTAISALEAAVQLKANQTLIDEGTELLASARTGYDQENIADNEVSALVESLNSKATAINNSATAYTNLNNAIGRLTEAIATASTDEARVAKSTLRKANLRLTASQNAYNEGTITDSDIADRV